jgi:hypothetical protein
MDPTPDPLLPSTISVHTKLDTHLILMTVQLHVRLVRLWVGCVFVQTILLVLVPVTSRKLRNYTAQLLVPSRVTSMHAGIAFRPTRAHIKLLAVLRAILGKQILGKREEILLVVVSLDHLF